MAAPHADDMAAPRTDDCADVAVAAALTAGTSTLLVTVDAPVVTIVVDRPRRLNALDRTVLADLARVLERLADVPRTHVAGAILTGAGGRAFVAGADIAQMQAMTPDEAVDFARLGQRVPDLCEALPIPIIAAVDGWALGGGCELVLGCDFAYATRAAVFGQPEVSLGLTMGFGGCVRLQRAIGPGSARELAFTGRHVDATSAARLGLVNEVFVDRATMLTAARATLLEVAERGPRAVSVTKRVMQAARGIPVADALAVECEGFREVFTTMDMREGTQAFLDRRAPTFHDR